MSLSFLPVWLGAVVFVVLTCAVSLLCYAAARRLLNPKQNADTRLLADSVVFRIGALHSLILALVFAQEQLKYAGLHDTIAIEISAISDIYYDLARYDEEANQPLQATMRDYVGIVSGREWTELADGRLSSSGWIAWDAVYNGVLDLEPQNLRQTSLRDGMLRNLDIISDSRNERELAAIDSVTDMFWVAAIFGLFLVMATYFTFAPTAIHLTLLTGFAAYNGLIFFFIAAMNNPFAEPVALEPTAFERALQNMDGQLSDTE